MPVNLNKPNQLYPVAGIRIATAQAGIRYTDRDDMVLFEIAEGANIAAVFTKNKYCAAPVVLARSHLEKNSPRALLVNAGNANAGTGELGMLNAQESCMSVGQSLKIEQEQVLPFSTGVIGEQLPMNKMNAGIDALATNLSTDNWLLAAQAIMTTDTIAKGISEKVEIGGTVVTITGIAKGSGMICPNMATLLSYVATDAEVDKKLLEQFLKRGADNSFNRITVDSDTSTNDALVLIATGKSNVKISHNDNEFYLALERILVSLATAVVRDGEGATKFVKIVVNNGVNESDCEKIAYSVAHSPLVKTALFASDPNWGRILAAIGKAPTDQLDINLIDIHINGEALIEAGQPASSYTEEIGQSVFGQEEITIVIDLHLGSDSYHVWTSDLSHEYVRINADYRS